MALLGPIMNSIVVGKRLILNSMAYLHKEGLLVNARPIGAP
jgi:hypothetical protein